jgi:ATP-dependent NAD(P)H-hydrate dehydratase
MKFGVSTFAWKEVFPVLKTLIPPLSFANHKGTMGRIGVIGGSIDFTGAPFYAADAALKFGADLSYVFCSQEAAAPIKSYSPELMVTPFYDDFCMFSEDVTVVEKEIETSVAKVKEFLSRVNVLVVGPGLGRNKNVMTAVSAIIVEAMANNTQ